MVLAQALHAFQQDWPSTVAAVGGDYHSNPKSQKYTPGSPTHNEGDHVSISLRTNPGFKRGEHTANKHLNSSTRECSDWLAHQFRKKSAKEIRERTGQGQRAAEAVKMGRNGLTMAHLVNICRADPEFRAAFFHFCGGQLEGSPELVANLSRAINAVMQADGALPPELRGSI